MIILNEREYAEDCLKNGLVDSKPFNTLSILAKYYYHICGYRKKKITTLLLEFLSKHYPRYELNEFSWHSSIEKIAANAGSYRLYEIKGVKITKSEMETITNIHNKVLERLMFTMLCLAKLSNVKNPKNNGWINAESKEIFEYARIACKCDEREVKIGKLWQMGLLEFSKRNDNMNCRVTFINDEDTEEMFVSDFRELGYEYMTYKGDNFIRCRECGILTRGNKNGTRKYCKDCATYIPQETKNITCIDCGITISVDSKNNSSCRCSNCQKENDKKMVRIRMNNYKLNDNSTTKLIYGVGNLMFSVYSNNISNDYSCTIENLPFCHILRDFVPVYFTNKDGLEDVNMIPSKTEIHIGMNETECNFQIGCRYSIKYKTQNTKRDEINVVSHKCSFIKYSNGKAIFSCHLSRDKKGRESFAYVEESL